MTKYCLLFVLTLFTAINISYAQRSNTLPEGKIIGKVIDATDNQPLEYANVILFDSFSQEMITGSTTNKEGEFTLTQIRPGRYYLGVKYIGYERETVDSLNINPGGVTVDIGVVKLKRAAYELDGVQVLGEQMSMEYKIDKKVINVGQQATVLSGTAVDVLQNAPSVTVDIEGNVSLRGSGDFTVLVDGKPSVLESNETLQTIPASTIDKIEIITNPSAKYDPEGTSGIINIVSKKNSLDGLSGLMNLNGGLDDKYGGDILVSYRVNDFNAYIGADYNKRTFPGTSSNLNETIIGGVSNFLRSSGSSKRGFSYNLTEKDIITLGGRYGSRNSEENSSLDYSEWTDPAGTENSYLSTETGDDKGNFYAANFDYTHNFSSDGHTLSLQAFYRNRDMDEENINEMRDASDVLTRSIKNIEGGPESEWRFNVNYKLPFDAKNYIEAGYQAEIENHEGFNSNYEFDITSNEYVFMPDFSNTNNCTKDIQSIFSTYTAELGNFGYQLGLRGEYTYWNIDVIDEQKVFELDRFDLFPTLHFSYSFGENTQMMASYTCRIVRPRDMTLEPYQTWMDAYNIRQGNPDLKPQSIDSYEAGFQKLFEWGSFSIEAYYRMTNNKFERVRSVYAENVMLHTYENVGKSYALGSEFMFGTSPLKGWNCNLTGNLYDYRQDGELYGESYENESFNWSLRLNNQFSLTQTLRLQLDMNFDSPTATSQGRSEGRYMLNAALKYEIIPRTLSATLQVRDLLASGKHQFTSQGPEFYSTMERAHKAPVVMLTLTYNINNYKQDKQRDQEQGEEMQGGDEEF